MTRHDEKRPGRTGENAGPEGNFVQPRARQEKAKPKSGGSAWDTVRTVFYAILIAVVVRTVLFEPFSIPSRSMLPTLLVGDYLFVSKFSYGYSKHSLPFSPNLFSGRIFFRSPKRGDVVVFKLPTNTKIDYIKRLIGLPGDRIQVKAGRLYINGKIIPRTPLGEYVDIERDRGNIKVRYKRYRETLPSGVSYNVLELGDNVPFVDNTGVYVVPKGKYFMMGDNRDNSQDSRYLNPVGFVPAENLVGRADFLFFSLREDKRWWQLWYWPGYVRFNRIFSSIK